MTQLDCLYASDHPWIKYHWDALKDYAPCLLLTQHSANHNLIDLPIWSVFGRGGCNMRDSVLNFGGNSGFAAIHLASLWGAARILLLGIDCKYSNGKRHWFGDHPEPINKTGRSPSYAVNFERANCPTPIINCSRDTALTCFPRATIEEVL